MLNRPRTLALVLAGGEGKRLLPLTHERAKPAVPFGGQYRLIDFVLSNLVNAGFVRIVVLTQYKSHSLDRHLATTWRMSPLLGNYVATVPAQMRVGRRWFEGSADAIYQNFNILSDEKPDYVLVFGSDHIYRMDPRQMLSQHIDSGAGVTVAAIRVPRDEASSFGVIEADSGGKILDFWEKPESPPSMPGCADKSFVSMGNYIFTTSVLKNAITRDAEEAASGHDMGANIIPMLVEDEEAFVYDFELNQIPEQAPRELGYWRDVGTLDSYYQASMDLVSVEPVFDLYNKSWPIFSWQPPLPPAKLVHEEPGRRSEAYNCLISKGAIVSGGTVRRCILGPDVRVRSYALVEDSVLFEDVQIGRNATVLRAIVDKHVKILPDAEIGVDRKRDRERFVVSPEGIVIVGKGSVVEPG